MSEQPTPSPAPAPAPIPELVLDIQKLCPTVSALEKVDRPGVLVPIQEFSRLMKLLHEDSRFAFDMLLTHTAVDRPAQQKIDLDYFLYSTAHRRHLLVQAAVPRTEPVIPSVSSLWMIAEWLEREVYDLFGVHYADHPDLRRLFLEDDWKGHPLLKDYKDDFMLERPW